MPRAQASRATLEAPAVRGLRLALSCLLHSSLFLLCLLSYLLRLYAGNCYLSICFDGKIWGGDRTGATEDGTGECNAAKDAMGEREARARAPGTDAEVR